MPASVDAEYTIGVRGASVGTLALSGMRDRLALLGDGSSMVLPALDMRLQMFGEPGFYRITHFLGNQGRLASASIGCEECVKGAVPSLRFIPDAADLPAFFGIGPLLGTTVSVGEKRQSALWDPVSAVSMEWTVGGAPSLEGRPCVWVTIAIETPSKVPVLMAPLSARILDCEGNPLPVRVEGSNWTADLVRKDFSGAFTGPTVAIPVVNSTQVCGFIELPRNRTTLPTSEYFQWARQNDSYVIGWLASHPNGLVMPGFGNRPVPSSRALLTMTYSVVGPLVLFDGDSAWEFRQSSEQHAYWTATGEEFETEMMPSGEIATVSSVSGTSRSEACDDALLPLADFAPVVVPLMPHSYYVKTFVTPELLSAPQDSSGLLGPFARGEFSLRQDLMGNPMPPRVYVSTSGPPGTFSVVAGASLDPVSKWIRWITVDAAAWSPLPVAER